MERASYFSCRRDAELISHRLQGLISHLQPRLIKRVVQVESMAMRDFSMEGPPAYCKLQVEIIRR